MIEILCAGDLHRSWDDVDRRFVESGSQDLVVFVGDLGHNDLRIVREIASLECPKFVLLGNHDAWDEMLGSSREQAREAMGALGDSFGGYRAQSFADGRMGVVGCRPFSWGGNWERDYGHFYRKYFRVESDKTSAAKIVDAASALGDIPLILVGHHGPAGLGDGRNAIFGRDFAMPHIDFGDRDFRLAVDGLRARQPVIATLAGHMHTTLSGGGQRQRSAVEGGTLHINAAVVPRHKNSGGTTLRHYVRLRISTETEAEDIWVDDEGKVASATPLI